MNKKFPYLFLALLLPGLIFIFLKVFGRNKFDVPVFDRQNLDSLNVLCSTRYTKPYAVPDSVLNKIGWKKDIPALLILNGADKNSTEFKRVADTFPGEDYQEIAINDHEAGPVTRQRWNACVFFIAPTRNAVLLDGEKRIRGYYALGSREEVDRLILEMKILLGKY